jgi:hypothetical protein
MDVYSHNLHVRTALSRRFFSSGTKTRTPMVKYNLASSYSECGRLHSTSVSITVGKRFAMGTTINDIYGREPLPSTVMKLLRSTALCPVTGASVIVEDADRVVLDFPATEFARLKKSFRVFISEQWCRASRGFWRARWFVEAGESSLHRSRR